MPSIKMNIFLLFTVSILIFLSAAPAATAQETRGSIFGTVSDQNGAVVQGAAITATQQATNLKFNAVTNRDGNFRLPLLPVGEYNVSVSATNFRPYLQPDIGLRVGEERRFDVRLSISSAVAVVDIAPPPATDTATATLATVIPAERVANLPLNGRQLQELALTAPGVSASGGFRSSAFNQFGLATPTDGNAGAFSVNGAGTRSNGFFLDGVDINIPEQGVISFPPIVDSIREFQIQTNNFSAEYGRFSGSIVNFVTKSGTNKWHGSAYEFFRNDSLDANDPFLKAAGLPRSVLRQNQFGANIGGPILKDKIFIFGSYEGNYVRQGTGAFTSNLPTFEQRAGIINYTQFTDINGDGQIDPGELSPATLNVNVNPISAAVLDGFIPLPNSTSPGANFITDGVQSLDENAYSIRGDARFTDKDALLVRYSYDDQRQFFPFDIFFVSASLPAFPFPNPERRHSLAGSYTRTFTQNFINEVRFGFNRQINPIPSGTTIDPASIGLPNGLEQNQFSRGLPIIRVTGFGGTGGQPLTDNLGASTTTRNLYQYIDNATWIIDDHTLRFGGEFRSAEIDQTQFRPLRGALTFNGSRNGIINPLVPGNAAVAALADFLQGLPAQAQISSADPRRIFQTRGFHTYIQDEWRANDRLNLSLGLRYELDTPIDEAEGRISNLIPGVGNFVIGSSELPRLHRFDRNNFAPRFGAAYLLTKDGKNVIRGGGGVFYDNGVLQDRFGTARANAPFAITAIDNNPSPFPSTGSADTLTRLRGAGAATSAASVDTNFSTPYAIQWNLNFQREVLSNTLAEIAYVGRRGQNLSRQLNINQIVAANSPAAAFAPVGSRPFAGLDTPVEARFANDIIQQQSTGSSIYHSFQAKVERRLTKGSSFLAAYTWSKSIDTASGIGTGQDDRPQDSFNAAAQRAVSNFDTPHRFVFSSTFALPFGKGQKYLSNVGGVFGFLIRDWQTNSITTWQSGQPFTVFVGSFDAVTGISNRRPNLVGDPFSNVPDGFAFNPNAFAVPPAGQLGNVGRNTVRGGSYYNSDFGVTRTFSLPFLGEGGNLQFRSEFFNIWNTVNFTRPVQNRSSLAFGSFASNATSPRVIQFGVKVNF
ncbi:MAG: carboxypeptidase regulatory-like domain-containing protein [Pyrinomonadaceae bacterium]